MIIFKTIADVNQYIAQQKDAKRKVGFVPTMGALHAGHRSLVVKARQESDIVVCSIFVNPTQFNDKSDYDKYPVTIDADIEMLIGAGCDVLFLPAVDEMYPVGTERQTYDFGYLETILEGAMRPGHFKGVGQVVATLINAVIPDVIYIGQKDYQQCLVITELVSLMGKDDIAIVICPTTREADGLAMSSRNRRLTEPQRALAGVIYQCLISIESKRHNTPFSIVKKECLDLLSEKGFVPEYVEIADAKTLKLLGDYDNNVPMVALIAAKLGGVRLIDNIILSSN